MNLINSIKLVLEVLSSVLRPNGDGTYSRLPDSESHKLSFKKLPNLGIPKVIRGLQTSYSGNQAHRATDGSGRLINERPHGAYSSSGNSPKFNG